LLYAMLSYQLNGQCTRCTHFTHCTHTYIHTHATHTHAHTHTHTHAHIHTHAHTQPGSKSREVLEAIAGSWFLVSVTDNQYTAGEPLPSILA